MRRLSNPALIGAILAIGACSNPNEADPIPEGSRRLSVGPATACALDPQGSVYCWGANTSLLEYGASSVPASPTPIAVPVQRLRSISGGWGQHRCGLTGTEAICWGRGQNG